MITYKTPTIKSMNHPMILSAIYANQSKLPPIQRIPFVTKDDSEPVESKPTCRNNLPYWAYSQNARPKDCADVSESDESSDSASDRKSNKPVYVYVAEE